MIPAMNAIERACDLVGGVGKLADLLGVRDSTVTQWRKGTRPVPRDRGVRIELVTNRGVTRQDLYPTDYADFWPELVATQPTTTEPAQAGV
jgi:DNA-binding transcriptional regulator YdaS (Cro superfamily)